MKNLKYILLLTALYLTSSNFLYGNSVEIKTTSPSSITACGEAETFEVTVVNTTGTALVNPVIDIDLPDGIFYTTSSLSETTSRNVAESNVADANRPYFSSDNIPNDDSITFSIDIYATVEAVNYLLDGNIITNDVTVNFTGGSENVTSNNYNLLYAALNITNVTPTSQTIASGDSSTRTITIVNAGYGRLSSFDITDIRNGGQIELTGSDLGTLSGDTLITLSAADFATIGNNDGYFDSNESITITETLLASGCEDVTITSTINTSWGCTSDLRIGTQTYAHITINYRTPNIKVTTQESLVACFGSGLPSSQKVTLNNSGQGTAKSLVLDLFKASGSTYDQSLFSRIDPSSIQYRIGSGSFQSITPQQTFSTNTSGAYSCLGANAIGRAILNLPDLNPGERMEITWDMYHCNVNTTNNEKVKGWRYDLDYIDACGVQTYNKTGTGQNDESNNMSLFTESPTDIDDGQEDNFRFTVSSHSNQLPVGDNAQYEVVFTLPAGLTFSGNTQDLTYTSANTTWSASSMNYNTGTNTITAYYDLNAPFAIPKSEFNLKLTGDCSAASAGTKTISMDINYIPESTCSSVNSIPFVENETISVDLHCPLTGPCEGMTFLSYSINRTSFGSPDNNQDGLADASGSLDMSRIKDNRAMVGDTLAGTFKGIIGTSGTHPTWSYGYASSAIELGTNLTSIGAEVTVYDASSAQYLTSNSAVITNSTSGTTKTFYFDYSPSRLQTGNASFSGFTFEDGDSVIITSRYEVTGNIGGQIKEVRVDNDFYVSNVQNPTSNSDKYQCDYFNDKFSLIGYYFTTYSNNNFTVKSCSRTIHQDFALSIGDCCSNYAGGNLFPFEYRNWAHVAIAEVEIPDHYILQSSYVRYKRTRSTNASTTNTVNPITPTSTSGNTFTYNLEQYYQELGGNVPFSDDGFSGTLYLVVAPTCDVPNNTYQNVTWKFKFDKTDYLGAGLTDWYTGTDRIRFNPTNLAITSTNPIVDGLEKTVSWNVNVKNASNNTDAAYSWIHLKAPSGDLTILSVTDASSGDTLTANSDYFELGTINRKKTRNLVVTAAYSACNVDRVWAYTGYECSGYPSSFSAFTCNYSQMELRVEPKPAELQSIISGNTVGDACSNTVEITVEIASVKLASADSIKVSIAPPANNSITYANGSSMIKYPLSGSFTAISDPVANASNLDFNISSIEPTIGANALPGVLDLSNNRFQMKFNLNIENNYSPGDVVGVIVNGQEICGTILPSINMSYDPSVKFSKNTTSGLSNDNTDNWSISWTDYNNDGYDDVLMSNYAENQANQLYTNNGDGTFTTTTNAGSLTADRQSTVATTWADFDNDGRIDVFVANNIGTANKLYRNNGNGTFSKVSDNTIYTNGFYSHSAAWVDYDNDGYVDIFAAEYMPTKFNLMLKNNGDGTFSNVQGNIVVQEAAYSIGATWSDFNNDGFQDLFVPNGLNGTNSLYKNEGGGVFTKVSTGGIDTDIANSVGSSWGDYDNDGDQDLFVANASNQANFLYNNNGDGTFTKVTSGIVVTDLGHSHGSSWGDIDNDGDLDLFVTNDQNTPNSLYINNGDGTFSRPDVAINTDLANSFGAAMSDYDNDGDLDIAVANHSNQVNDFYSNGKGNCNSWIGVKLTGTRSNKSAIGAKVRVKANLYGTSTWQLREISSQTGGGAGGQNSLKAMFGLADATEIDSIIVDWPSGTRQYVTNVNTINQVIYITEEDGVLVNGKAYHDANQNCVYDAGETVLAGKRIVVAPENRIITTNQDGNYETYLLPGSHTISYSADDNWESTCSSLEVTHNITIADTIGEEYRNLDFPLVAVNEKPDCQVTLGTSVLRRGFRNTISVAYQNDGAFEAQNTTLTLHVGSDIEIVGSDVAWDSNVDTTYTWNLGTLAIGDHGVIILEDSINLFATLGDQKTIQAIIACTNTETDYTNNQMTVVDTIVGSLDPNDKLVFPKGYGPAGLITLDDTLTYKIRFQNVGNYEAYRVIVIDTLSEYLDVTTIHDITLSHEGSYTLDENGIFTFTFIGINLPDSTTNEPESHGFIQFKIAPNPLNSVNSIIRNSAAIQFDFNDYLITNTVVNTVVTSVEEDALALRFYPNPAKDYTTLEIYANKLHLPIDVVEASIMSAGGIKIKEFFGYEIIGNRVDISDLPPGLYNVQAVDKEGISYYGKMIKQ